LRYGCRLKSWRPEGQKIEGSIHVYIHNLKAPIKAKETFILIILLSLQTIRMEDLWDNPYSLRHCYKNNSMSFVT